MDSPGSAAVEEIMSLGTPKGRERMTSVAIRLPVEPPMAITPSSFPWANRSPAILEAPLMVMLVILDRSLEEWISSRLLPPASATCAGVISAGDAPFPRMEISMSKGLILRDSILSLRYRVSTPLVSRVEIIKTAFRDEFSISPALPRLSP